MLLKAKKLDRYIKYSSNPFYDFIMDFYGKPPYDVYFQLFEEENKVKKRRKRYFPVGSPVL